MEDELEGRPREAGEGKPAPESTTLCWRPQSQALYRGEGRTPVGGSISLHFLLVLMSQGCSGQQEIPFSLLFTSFPSLVMEVIHFFFFFFLVLLLFPVGSQPCYKLAVGAGRFLSEPQFPPA